MSQSDDSPQHPDWCQQVHLPGQPHRGESTVNDADTGHRAAIVALSSAGDFVCLQVIQTGPWRLVPGEAEALFYVLTSPELRVAAGAQTLAGAEPSPGPRTRRGAYDGIGPV
jgi:hypothetical protein